MESEAAQGKLAMTAEQQRSWEEDGVIVIDDFFESSELEALLAAVDRVKATVEASGAVDAEHGFAIRNLVEYDDAFLELIDHPRMLPLVVDAFGANIQLRTSHLDYRPPYPDAVQAELRNNLQPDPSANAVPGARNVGWHPDLSGLFAEASHDDVLPMMEIKAYYTLSDTRESNCGNLWLVAGSFKRKTSELTDWKSSGTSEPPPGAMELRLPPGAAVLWRTGCWHCVGPQLGTQTRKIIHIGYQHRWLRPTDFMEQEPALLARCSPIRQQLLGAVPSGAVMGANEFEPTSAYYRMHDADVPLKVWAEEQQQQRQQSAKL